MGTIASSCRRNLIGDQKMLLLAAAEEETSEEVHSSGCIMASSNLRKQQSHEMPARIMVLFHPPRSRAIHAESA